MTVEKDVLVLLRVPDGVAYIYNLPDGRRYQVVYDGGNGSEGLLHPCVGLPREEAERLFKLGVALRYVTPGEMERNVKKALAQKAATRTGEFQ
jgi:hypothetical protein